MNDYLEEIKAVEQLRLTHTGKFVAATALASLRYFRELAVSLGVQMQDLRPEDILSDLKRFETQNPRENASNRVEKPGGFERGSFVVVPEAIAIRVERRDRDRQKK